MARGYTTIEQSKKLLSLGFDPSTADMYYIQMMDEDGCYDEAHIWVAETVEEKLQCETYKTPAWSLTSLLELIPYTIKDDFSKCIFQMSKYDTGYQISYVREGNHHCAIWSYYEELVVDAAFKMVCWLIEQGHIKVNK